MRIERQLRIGPEQQTDEHGGEIDVGLAPSGAIGKAIEQGGQLLDHVRVQRREPAAELWPAQRRDADLLEEHATVAIGGDLEEEEVEATRERPLRIEDVELRPDRASRVLDELIDGRDQQGFLRLEVVMDEARRHAGLGGDALDRSAGEAVLHDRVAQPVDDLPAPRLGEAGTSHGVNWLTDQPINVNRHLWA